METTLENTPAPAAAPTVRKPSGVVENRAFRFCEHLKQWDGGPVHVEWKKSAMYGFNPSIDFKGKCSNISGCGYDKLSACLAQVLRWLAPDPDTFEGVNSGAGIGRVAESLEKCGWKLTRDGGGKTWDAFTLNRILPPDPPPVGVVAKGMPADPDDMNEERAAWADAAVKGFLKAHKGEAAPDIVLTDLLCDLHHWADRNGADYAAALQRSKDHYEAETDGTQDTD